jgi:SAM-dependent methyltransferase
MTAQSWQSDFYDDKLGFVSELGRGMVDLLAPKRGETILDLGCGTGDLAHEIAQRGAAVIGIDLSADMIAAAREKYPGLDFRVGDGERFTLEQPVDAVFSNAALHWMRKPERVIRCVWNALKPGGRFVAEFGGKGNVGTVVDAIIRVLRRDFGMDVADRNPWYFPGIGEYSALLERQGFHVVCAAHLDRPTRMQDGRDGLRLWIRGFADFFFEGLGDRDKETAIAAIESETRDGLHKDGAWHIDYKRLRIIAVKPAGE